MRRSTRQGWCGKPLTLQAPAEQLHRQDLRLPIPGRSEPGFETLDRDGLWLGRKVASWALERYSRPEADFQPTSALPQYGPFKQRRIGGSDDWKWPTAGIRERRFRRSPVPPDRAIAFAPSSPPCRRWPPDLSTYSSASSGRSSSARLAPLTCAQKLDLRLCWTRILASNSSGDSRHGPV